MLLHVMFVPASCAAVSLVEPNYLILCDSLQVSLTDTAGGGSSCKKAEMVFSDLIKYLAFGGGGGLLWCKSEPPECTLYALV